MNDLSASSAPVRNAGGPRQDRGVQGSLRNIESDGRREFNPAGIWPWTCATCCWSASASRKSALACTESRGGYTRDDYPKMDADWRHSTGGVPSAGDDPVMPEVTVTREQQEPMREDPLELVRNSKNSGNTSPTRSWRSTRDGRARDELQANLRVWRGDDEGGGLAGLLRRGERGRGRPRHHPSAAGRAGSDLAVRWNCKAASAAPARRRSTAVRG